MMYNILGRFSGTLSFSTLLAVPYVGVLPISKDPVSRILTDSDLTMHKHPKITASQEITRHQTIKPDDRIYCAVHNIKHDVHNVPN